MENQPITPASLAIERAVGRAAEDRSRPGQHTLVMGGSAAERSNVLDRIEARLRHDSPGTPPHIGRVRKRGGKATSDASQMWNEAAAAAGLGEADHVHTSGLGRIQHAAGQRRFVAIVDDLDTVLAGWDDAGEALNLRWALQNVNGLTVIAGAEGPIGRDRPHEHAILGMTFASQTLEAPDARRA